MPKFKVTIAQTTREWKDVIVEADDEDSAADTVRDGDEFISGDGYQFSSVPERWIDDVEEMETEDGKA